MSLQAITAVSNNLPLPAALAGFLFTLANHHNAGDNRCHPSVEMLCNQLMTSRRTVHRWFNEAEQRGVITRSARYVKGRQVSSDVQFIDPNLGVTPVTPRGDTDGTLGGDTSGIPGGCHRCDTSDTPGGDTSGIQKQEIKKQKDIIQQPDPVADAIFTEFWSRYPKKVDKKKAKTAFMRLTKTKQQAAIADCANRYRDTPKKFIPNPTTYIHGERWEDESPTSVITPDDYNRGGI